MKPTESVYLRNDAPEKVWMHNSLGYWFSVADKCVERGDVEYVRADLFASALAAERREVFQIGWDEGFQEAHRPDLFPQQNRCEVIYQERFGRPTQ